MSRYIDANTLAYMVTCNGDADFINKVTKLMIEAPSIDIVFCRECKHKDTELCAMYKLVAAGVRKYDDFCSYGESKE